MVVPPWPKSVIWYNKEGRIESNTKYRMSEDGSGIFMIEVRNAECCDKGEWKCVVTSLGGTVGISSCSVEMDSNY